MSSDSHGASTITSSGLKQPYHLVDPSPWPLVGALAGGMTLAGIVLAAHYHSYVLLVAGLLLAGVAEWRMVSVHEDIRDALRAVQWPEGDVAKALPKLKPNGSLYIFLTWRFSPEIFVMLKQRMTMMNEIIWDRRVPSMGGSVRPASA